MKRTIIGFLICFAMGGWLRAQSELELFTGGYSPGSEITGTDFDNGALLGFRLGHSIARIFGTEFSYTYVKSLQEVGKNFDGHANLLNGNFLLQLPLGKPVPFVTLGLGSIIGESNTFLRVKSAFAWNAGGGLKIRRMGGPVGLRVDVRYYKVPDGVEIFGVPDIRGIRSIRRVDFDFAEVSGGILFSF
jgi:hypothetical protein